MANRHFHRVFGSPSRDLIIIDAVLSVTAAGAVSATYSKCKFGSFAKTGTGLYTLTLSDAFPGPVIVSLTPMKATAADTGWELVSAPGVNGTTGKIITLRHITRSTGNAVDPGAVSAVHVQIMASNAGGLS